MLASIRWQRIVALPFALLVALAVMVGTAGDASASPHPYRHHSDHAAKKRLAKIDHAKHAAKRQRGDGYRYGASGPGHFDCSGLTKYAFKQADIKMPRTSDGQYHRVRHINKGQLKKGDLVFFYDGGGIYHVGMYWGKKNGHKRVLHASEPGDPVKIDKIWTSKYKAGTLRWRH